MATTWSEITKIGAGWEYNEEDYTYNQALDSNTGAIIHYDSVGIATVWTEANKP